MLVISVSWFLCHFKCVSSGVLVEQSLRAQVPNSPQSLDISSNNGFVLFLCLFIYSFFLLLFVSVFCCSRKNGLEVLGGIVTNSLKKFKQYLNIRKCKFIKCFTSNYLYLGCPVLLRFFFKAELLCIVINDVNCELRRVLVCGRGVCGLCHF